MVMQSGLILLTTAWGQIIIQLHAPIFYLSMYNILKFMASIMPEITDCMQFD